MKKSTLLFTCFLLLGISRNTFPAVITFEGQNFGTENWTENGINWNTGVYLDIRDYDARTGSNHLMLTHSADYLTADHKFSLGSLWLVNGGVNTNNTYISFTGYDSEGQVVSTRTYNPPAFSFDYQSIIFSGFTNITKLVFTFDGSPEFFIDDINYTDGGVLPVELSSFAAYSANSSICLKWSTSTEVNNFGFDIERAPFETISGGNSWQKIGFVKGNGNSNSMKEYSFSDKDITAGKYLYRLKQIDNDGQFKYSRQAEVSFMQPGNFILEQNYPNPFNPSTSIRYFLPSESRVKISVYNEAGQKVDELINTTQNAGNYDVMWNAVNFASGVYVYSIETFPLQGGNSFKSAKKMILEK